MSSPSKFVAILNPDYEPVVEREMFAKAGYQLIVAQCSTDEETIAAVSEAEGIIDIYCKITDFVARNIPKCKVIVRAGVGYDMIDVKACRANGIQVCNVPDYCTEEVSDHAVALMMMLQRKLMQHFQFVQAKKWDGMLVGEVRRLNALTLGVIGFGAIGRRFAVKMKEIVPNIIAFDPYLDDGYFQKIGVKRVGVEDALLNSDLISLHCPLTPENYHIISNDILNRMTRKPIIINTSRGGLIDQEALIKALEEGLISAAGLDVVENEPNVPQKFLTMNNVIITPHTAWYSTDADLEDRTRSVEDVLRVMHGENLSFIDA